MKDRDSNATPEIFSIEAAATWHDTASNPPVPTLTPLQLSILRRVAQGNGLFRLLDENLKPVYDFGPSETADAEAVESLVAAQAIQFHTTLGYRLPARAQLTAWGKAFLEDDASGGNPSRA